MQAATLSVLIVDDHEPLRTLLRRVLKRAGVHAVREAAQGEAALALLQQAPADLLLCDQNMPGMSGLELAACLRADPRHAGLRIVMLTGEGGEKFAQQARAAGADAVLLKPVAPSALMAALNSVFAAAA